MKRRTFVTTVPVGFAGLAAGSCSQHISPVGRDKLFSFVHFSDVHVQPELGGREGFLTAIDKMNSLKPDFAIGGGDLVMDATAVDETRTRMLYDMYVECCEQFDMPVYDVIGNHELFGTNDIVKVPESHPEWGKEMFRKRLGDGNTYQSFDHKGVHFILVDSTGLEKNRTEQDTLLSVK